MLVEFVVLLMPHCSREYLLMQDYGKIEALYFERNPRVQLSEWNEWWYDAEGNRHLPDRWRLWNMRQEHHCSAYTRQLRNTPWVQTTLRKMRCPPKPFDVYSPAPVPPSSVQGPGFQHCREGME